MSSNSISDAALAAGLQRELSFLQSHECTVGIAAGSSAASVAASAGASAASASVVEYEAAMQALLQRKGVSAGPAALRAAKIGVSVLRARAAVAAGRPVAASPRAKHESAGMSQAAIGQWLAQHGMLPDGPGSRSPLEPMVAQALQVASRPPRSAAGAVASRPALSRAVDAAALAAMTRKVARIQAALVLVEAEQVVEAAASSGEEAGMVEVQNGLMGTLPGALGMVCEAMGLDEEAAEEAEEKFERDPEVASANRYMDKVLRQAMAAARDMVEHGAKRRDAVRRSGLKADDIDEDL